MGNSVELFNRRILVIDDNASIHGDFRKILGGGLDGESSLSEAATALFGHGASRAAAAAFQIDTASQGQEGVAMVRRALEDHRPYALAFIDMRMPPGWDGIETASRIWDYDPEMLVVICTAYSDYSWDEILVKFGRTHRFFVLKKPFDNIEVLQLANALTENWRLSRQSKLHVEQLERSIKQLSQNLRQ